MALSPSAKKIQDLLHTLGYEYTVIEFEASTRTATEAAQRVDCEVGQIVKSLIFRTQESNRPVLILTSGANRVNEKRIAEYLGEPILRADPDFVREVTGFAIGGVPPIGHARPMITFIDEDLLQHETLWAAAGNPRAMFQLTPTALRKMTAGKVVCVK